MTLRSRLIVTTIALAVPLAGVLFLLAERARHADMDRALETVLATAGCAPSQRPPGPQGPEGPRGQGPRGRGQGPRGQGRGGPPAEVFPYSDTFSPATRDGRGPVFPEDLRVGVLADGRASGVYVTDDGRGRQMAVRADESDGDCAYLLARVRPRPGELRDQVIGLASIVGIVVLAVLLAAGPTVARIHRLSTAVAKSALTFYDTPVPEQGQDEVANLGRAFNAAGASIKSYITDIESREQALRSFVANTAHDLATPLTVLQTHLATLEQAATTDQRTHVASAIREAHYMGSLLRNLSAASRLDGGLPLDLRAIDLSALVERVVARHMPLARSAGVELNLAVPPAPLMVTADATLAEQAIGNLVDNAIRYNHPGGHVGVVLDTNAITVVDDGIGVAPGDLSSLASRRFRGEAARSRRPDGQGLGLSITAEAAAVFGWRLTFAHNEPKGLIASITFDRSTLS